MALTALLEPTMILVMGGVVLTIVLAVLMPIMEMNQLGSDAQRASRVESTVSRLLPHTSTGPAPAHQSTNSLPGRRLRFSTQSSTPFSDLPQVS